MQKMLKWRSHKSIQRSLKKIKFKWKMRTLWFSSSIKSWTRLRLNTKRPLLLKNIFLPLKKFKKLKMAMMRILMTQNFSFLKSISLTNSLPLVLLTLLSGSFLMLALIIRRLTGRTLLTALWFSVITWIIQHQEFRGMPRSPTKNWLSKKPVSHFTRICSQKAPPGRTWSTSFKITRFCSTKFWMKIT